MSIKWYSYPGAGAALLWPIRGGGGGGAAPPDRGTFLGGGGLFFGGGGGGGGGGRAAPPDRGTFFRRQVNEMVGILPVIKGVGKSVGKKAEKS